MSGLRARLEVERRPRLQADAAERPFRLDLQLDAGDGITVVCGASGAGKSTLLLALLGALRTQCGEIRLDGRVLLDTRRGVELKPHERRIGLVFQDAPLFPHMTVRENVAFAAGDRATADELLERLDALELADRPGSRLSGGERQRVALARALGARPRALLLDEPFSALDPAARRRLGAMLVELQRDSGIPFVHVTHDMDEALRLGQRLVLLDRGRVVEVGPPAELLARPASIAAARAAGTENLYDARVLRHDPGDGCSLVDLGGTQVRTLLLDDALGAIVRLGLRGEDVLLAMHRVERTSARNLLSGEIVAIAPDPPATIVTVNTPAPVRVVVTEAARRSLGLEIGGTVHLLVKASGFSKLL